MTQYTRILETGFNAAYYLGTDTNGTAYKLIVDDSISPYGTASGGSVTTNANTIVTATYSSSNTTGTLYVNGVSVGSDSTHFTTPTSQNLPLYVMESVGGGSFYWNGYLAEAIIYNRALSASELLRVHTYLGNRYAITI